MHCNEEFNAFPMSGWTGDIKMMIHWRTHRSAYGKFRDFYAAYYSRILDWRISLVIV